jgi:hypothetical protein
MATYAQLADCTDPALTVEERHLDDADVYVNLALYERGITPADVVLPQPTLTAIAVAWAKRQSAVEGAIGENSPLIDKARQYETTAKTLVAKLSRAALGLAEPTGTAYGSIVLGRA